MSIGHRIDNTNPAVTALENADAKTREKNKSAYDKARDVSYTINHAIVCTIADVFGAPINAWTQKKLGTGLVGCGHDHGPKGAKFSAYKSALAHIGSAEFAGDVLAVPLTIGMQRHAPGLMNGLNQVMEPLFGDLFRIGAKSNAYLWAKKNKLDPKGEEALQKARETYQHEVEHLSQAGVWTAAAFALNIGLQYTTERIWVPKDGLTPLRNMLIGKGVGSTVSSAALVGLRGFAPNAAEGWDHWSSKNIVLPVSRKASGLFGLSQKEIDAFEKEVMEQHKRDNPDHNKGHKNEPHKNYSQKPDKKVHEAKLETPMVNQAASALSA